MKRLRASTSAFLRGPRRPLLLRRRCAARLRTAFAPFAACMVPAVLAHAATHQNALTPAGVQAAHIVRLWNLTLVVTGAVFAAVLAIVLVALARRGRRADESTPPDLGGSARPERAARRAVVAASAASVLLLAGITVADALTDRALSRLPVANALHIDLVGWQWWWQANYARDGDAADFTVANELHVPVGRPVVISLAAGDVIHGFWVPNLHGKKDLLPGISTTIEFRADKAGVYRGQCAEFCGAEHALMAMTIVAEAPERYAAWAARQREPAGAPANALAVRGRQIFEQSSCAGCHTVRGTSAAGSLGPDLTHLMSRQTLAAGSIPNDAASLAAWIRDPNAAKPGATMPASSLPAADLQALVAWLTTLR